jgi:plasmid stabilization system protein ParE
VRGGLIALGFAAAAGPAMAQIACLGGEGEVRRICYAEPTERYPHGVLGDELEWGALVFHLGDGRSRTATLSESRVFEDVAPRAMDLDRDGAAEAVVVESSREGGARLAVWGLVEGELKRIAATPEIGRRFRWLAPVGIADLDGDGAVEIAYVETPHLNGILRVWRFADGELSQVAYAEGWSNHRIGDDFILSGVRDCGDGPELVLPDRGWTGLFAVRLREGRLSAARIGQATREGLEEALACE